MTCTVSHYTSRGRRFVEALARRVLVLDGAMGTMIQRLHLTECDFRGAVVGLPDRAPAGCNDLLCLTQPALVAGIHRQYLDAGADIISTNTFNANSLSLEQYGLSSRAREISCAGASLASDVAEQFARRRGVGRPFVAGNLGPSCVSLSYAGVSDPVAARKAFDNMITAYREQTLGLMEGGVDVLLFETCYDLVNVRAAIDGLSRAFELSGQRVPVWFSATLTQKGLLPAGATLEEFVATVRQADPELIGLNCGFGVETIEDPLKRLIEFAPCRVCVHPNAGLPDDKGHYAMTPEMMAVRLRPIIESGKISIVGGCCGTVPAHISAIAGIVGSVRFRS